VVVAQPEAISCNPPGGTEGNHENLSQDSICADLVRREMHTTFYLENLSRRYSLEDAEKNGRITL
jgi:hypothetical protein